MEQQKTEKELNAEKTALVAKGLYPNEKWEFLEDGIYVAKSRLLGNNKEQAKLYREISSIRILISRGSTAYFLPERPENENVTKKDELVHNMHADTVIDGVVVELKTAQGNRTTLGKSFRRGYKQGRSLLKKHGITAAHSVFLHIFTPFSIESIRGKIAGELKDSTDKGCCICFFEASQELYFWDYDELKRIIKK